MSTTLFLSPGTPQSHSHPGNRADDAASAAAAGRFGPGLNPLLNSAGGNIPYDDQDDPPERRQYRLLSHEEWVRFCRGVGVFKDDRSEEVTRPTCALWPAKGFRDGLYQDVLIQETKYAYLYYSLSLSKWVLLLLQIALGSILTALGSFASQLGIPITVIAAINTGVAGVLALLHNSGLPERFRSDRNEFRNVEEHIKYIVDTALVLADEGGGDVNEALAGCFERYRAARQSVENNIPAFYTRATPTNARGGFASQYFSPSSSLPPPPHKRRRTR